MSSEKERFIKDFVKMMSSNNATRNIPLESKKALAEDEWEQKQKRRGAPTVGQNIFSAELNTLGGYDFTDIESLNTFIGVMYRAHFQDESKTIRSTGTLKDILGDLCDSTEPVCAWKKIYASGNGSDCLIHSFLTATCPNFRKLSTEYKNQIARSFRHHLYPTFPLTQEMLSDPLKGPAAADRIFTVGQFLDDDDIAILFKSYKIDYILFESAKSSANGAMFMPPSVFYGNQNKSPRVYCICNNGNVHFEPVRTSEQQYFISKGEATAISERIMAKAYDSNVRTGCDFDYGDKVRFEGVSYQVLARRSQAPKCISYALTDEETFRAFQALPDAKRGSSAEEAKHTKVVAPADKVSRWVGSPKAWPPPPPPGKKPPYRPVKGGAASRKRRGSRRQRRKTRKV